jgi:6-phosphofructokinase 1
MHSCPASQQTDFLPILQSADVKYIDPSYIIRTVPTISNDRIYCKILAHNAVHAAFGGYTGITVVSSQNDQIHAVAAAVRNHAMHRRPGQRQSLNSFCVRPSQGLVNTHYVYLPIPTVISAPRKIGVDV